MLIKTLLDLKKKIKNYLVLKYNLLFQAIMRKNKKYPDKYFYFVFFIMFDFIFYYLLTLIIIFIKK